MDTKDEEIFKLCYDDFEPFCKWRREEEQEILEVHLQDFKKQHLRVQIQEPGVVTITGERHLDETLRSRFQKQIKIPKTCKTNEVRAKFSGGTLYVVLPKKNSAFLAKLSNAGSNTRSASMPSNYLFGIASSSSRLEIINKLALQVAGVLAVVVASGAFAYKYCHCHSY